MSGCIYRLLYNYTHTTQGGTIGRCVIAEACIKLLQMKFQCNNCFLSVQALIIYNNNQTTSLANLVQFKSSFCIRTLNTCIRPPFCNFVWLWLIVRSVTAPTCDQVLVPTCTLSVIVIVIVGIVTNQQSQVPQPTSSQAGPCLPSNQLELHRRWPDIVKRNIRSATNFRLEFMGHFETLPL